MISGYDPEAVRPVIGTLWVWEPDKPDAVTLMEVVDVWWNGEEWWVGTLHPSVVPFFRFGGMHRPRPDINELSRFWEAAHGIMVRPGPVRRLTRNGAPTPEEKRKHARSA